VLCERDWRGALEGGSQRWSLGRVADGQDGQQWQQGERDKQTDEESGEKRHPGRSVRRRSVGDEQRKEGDGDGRDRYPKPSSLPAKEGHSCFAEYTNDGVPGSEFLTVIFRLSWRSGMPSATNTAHSSDQARFRNLLPRSGIR
jgi:hypothetical protein